MKRFEKLLAALIVVVAACGGGAVYADDPGPHVQYGGTPIELHFDAPGANVTKANIDGTPCIIVSDSAYGSYGDHHTIALSCDWGPR